MQRLQYDYACEYLCSNSNQPNDYICMQTPKFKHVEDLKIEKQASVCFRAVTVIIA